jgi:hypothetical protein
LLSYTDVKYFKLSVGQDRIKRETDSDISAKCPLCHDKEPRLHLYENNGVVLVHCFRGECSHHSNLWNFIKLNSPALLDSYKRETFGEVMKSLKSSIETPIKKEQSKIQITPVPLEPLLKDVTESLETLEYLWGRKIDYDPRNFGKWYFGYQDLEIDGTLYKITNSVVIPLYDDAQRMYGFYSRSIKYKNFITYMHENNFGYKIWNWFNIDKELPVYIFEGIFDAISSGKKNIIALMGAKIPEERLKELKNPVFCLDNDKTGWQNGVYYSSLGYNIFIQPDLYIEKDMNNILQNHPELNISQMINDNIYTGISAQIRLKTKN